MTAAFTHSTIHTVTISAHTNSASSIVLIHLSDYREASGVY